MDRGGRKRRGRGSAGPGSGQRGSPRGRGVGGESNSNSPARNENEQQQAVPASPVVPTPEPEPEPVPVVEPSVPAAAATDSVSSSQPEADAEPVPVQVPEPVPVPDEVPVTTVEPAPETVTMPTSPPTPRKTTTTDTDKPSVSPVSVETPLLRKNSSVSSKATSPDPEFLTPDGSPTKFPKNQPEFDKTDQNKNDTQIPTPTQPEQPQQIPLQEPEPEPDREVRAESEEFQSPIKLSPAASLEVVSESEKSVKVPPKVPSRKNSPNVTPQQAAALAAAAVAAAEVTVAMSSTPVEVPVPVPVAVPVPVHQQQQEQQIQQTLDPVPDGKDKENENSPIKSEGEDQDEPTLIPLPALKKNSTSSLSASLTSSTNPNSHPDPSQTLLNVSGVQGKPGYLGGVASTGGSGDGSLQDSLLSTGSEPTAVGSSGGWMGFNRRQLLTLVVFSLADFFSAIIISLQAPFYPAEAELKGASATEYGLVFGVFELVVFLTSPIYGKYLHRVGPKLVFNAGILTTGITTILFGFLDRFPDHTTFIALSFLIRSIEAMGSAAFVTASFAIIASEFPQCVATTFASLETFFGLGLIVGPTLGGALYEKGGFTAPFAVMGGLLLAVALVTYMVMPNSKELEADDSGRESPGGVLAILKIPAVSLAAFSIVTGAITIGFLNSTLEPHIRQFTLTPVLTGLVFIINGGLYAVTAPAWGWLCDKTTNPRYVALIGAVTIFIGFLFIGPAPFLPFDTILWLTCVGLVVHGIGLGATLVAAFIMALRESIDHGFSDNIQTYGLTSALWTSSFALGSFIGPSVGGVLLDQIGFRWATLFVLGSQVVLTILILAFLAKKSGNGRGGYYKRNKLGSESAPLLGSNDHPCSSKTALALEKERSSGYGATGN